MEFEIKMKRKKNQNKNQNKKPPCKIEGMDHGISVKQS